MKLLLTLTALVLTAEGTRLLWYGTADPSWRSEPVLVCSFPPDLPRRDLDGSRAAEVLSYDAAEILRFSGPARRAGIAHRTYLQLAA